MPSIDTNVFISSFFYATRLIAVHIEVEIIPFPFARDGLTFIEKIRRIETELADERRLALFFDMRRFDAYDWLIFVIFIVHNAIIGREI